MKDTTLLNLEQNINRYISHKQALGNVYRQESWLLKKIVDFIKDAGTNDLDLFAYES